MRVMPSFIRDSPKFSPVSKIESRQSKVGQHQLLVSWTNLFNGLPLHKDLPLDDQVGAKSFMEPLSLLFDRNGNLTLNRPALLS